ncbi:ABC transporter substrate-binding protein [Yoonia sediminilitoris]|uniref:Glycine betaine/proline transport system substrate-binding protein n=1 Tax=Yoonia sediminilitoris TaxID=1286148 RepID=A0A2T6KEY5_9RHOB|nr:ABC transporter substrate-binding protein [Yoonia sediminilitoris]PUB13690.1 glycine betaine/proline transport system substrate-binding protein [Yoonia sediminilitoris]RCW94860.1 glycine betaine/proline transport system substrate-binding protein [Yoonia sediminilitoris]
MNVTLKTGIATIAIVTGMAAPAHADAIKIAVNEWTGQNLSAYIAGAVLQEMGQEVEYVTAGAVPQFAAIADGSLHFQPETWTNNVGEIYPKAVDAGDITVVGELGLRPLEGWFYPPYMEEQCPGLPSYEALYDCAQAFAAADTFPNGRLITYPADWGTRSNDQVAALGLPFQPVAGGSEGAMLAEMKSAIATEQPMLMMFWQPHWIHAEIALNVVEWDSSSPDCLAGVDQSRGNACGFAQASVQKIVSKDFADTWPEAYAFVESYELSNDVQNALIQRVDQDGLSVEEAVAEWMRDNEATWRGWTS